jgi:hydroxypyruvate isomerase
MKPAICFEMLYPDLDVNEKIKKVQTKGFNNIEFWSWRDKDLDSMKKQCNEIGVNVVNFSGQRRGDLVNPATHDLILEDFRESIKAAQKLNCKTLMVLTNELGEEGVVVNPYPEISEQDKFNAAIECLKKVMRLLPEDMTLVIEPLNTVLDHTGYYLYEIPAAIKLIEKVGDSRLKILCDLYHQGMMGDDLEFIIDNYLEMIGYIHIADVPRRHEPGTGTVDWLNILRKIKENGYNSTVGFEYSPKNSSNESLDRIKKLWNEL